MFQFNNRCSTKGNDSKLKLAENRSVMYIVNKQRKDYYDIQVDGCDITTGRKCDKGVFLDATKAALLIELKGSDIAHAVDQLTDSLRQYRGKISQLGASSIECFVISSNIPLSSTESQNMKIKFKKTNGVSLRIEGSNYCYNYS